MKLLIPDSSCIVALSWIDQVPLLHAIADEATIPPEVFREVGEFAESFVIREAPAD